MVPAVGVNPIAATAAGAAVSRLECEHTPLLAAICTVNARHGRSSRSTSSRCRSHHTALRCAASRLCLLLTCAHTHPEGRHTIHQIPLSCRLCLSLALRRLVTRFVARGHAGQPGTVHKSGASAGKSERHAARTVPRSGDPTSTDRRYRGCCVWLCGSQPEPQSGSKHTRPIHCHTPHTHTQPQTHTRTHTYGTRVHDRHRHRTLCVLRRAA